MYIFEAHLRGLPTVFTRLPEAVASSAEVDMQALYRRNDIEKRGFVCVGQREGEDVFVNMLDDSNRAVQPYTSNV